MGLDPITMTGAGAIALAIGGAVVILKVKAASEKKMADALESVAGELKNLDFDQLMETCDKEPETKINFQGTQFVRKLSYTFSEEPDRKNINNIVKVLMVTVSVLNKGKTNVEATHISKRKSQKSE